MSKKNKFNKDQSVIEFSLNEIQILKFKLNEMKEVNIDNDSIGLELGINGEFYKSGNGIHVTTIVKVFKELKSSKKNIAELKVKYSYNILGTNSLKENGKIVLPKNLIDMFNSISISSTRGILFTKFQGTKIQKFILPLIDPQKLNIEPKYK